MYRVTHSGTGATAGSIISGQVFNRIMAKATVDAVVEIDGHAVAIATADSWVTFDCIGNSFEVVSGTINYVVFG